ncbi:hypothetical protein OG978_09475 [Streptomyces sp. NBC_01591]|uniref:hypothetical protein n=1 Tax=Streptomyces sp. NBC_01591 TaxID=2975888 RepID=UPI002DDA7CD2|nr:hypothetical protein [Streptomyces sp. NBC_01591]WSD67590.1 hypothetical protein OG978_09475 [Streptomyces sp. NBC_01591]
MLTQDANRDSRLSFWLRVREFAVPPSMIETATARRHVGDWAGACAAAGIDVDLNPRSVAHTHGRELASRIRDDLRHLAPDLLRWHLPRIAPRGLLRPGLTVPLARYDTEGPDGVRPVHLVVRTPPAWADAGQRIGLALWDGSDSGADARRYPHHRPNPRFRLDLHRHLWDARRAGELRIRSGADRRTSDGPPPVPPEVLEEVPRGRRCAVDRWVAEAGILFRAEGRSAGTVAVRFGARHRLLLDLVAEGGGSGPPALRIAAATTAADGGASALPVLPDAATWVLPDLDLLRTGSIEAGRLHPLVAAALAPDHPPAGPARPPDRAGQPRLVECRGAQHRIGLVDGVLAPLDHDPAEIRREELLVALTGTPLPCLQAIDEAHRRPDCLTGVRERLDHGDIAGALAVVEGLLGPGALLRSGDLRDELEAAARRRITYGLFRAGLAEGPDRLHPYRNRPRHRRSHPRHAALR